MKRILILMALAALAALQVSCDKDDPNGNQQQTTPPVTTPVTPLGHLLFGFGCGCFTVLIRYFGSYPEGVSYSILIMNLCTWSIDKLFRRYQFGVSRADKLMAKATKLAEKEARSRG